MQVEITLHSLENCGLGSSLVPGITPFMNAADHSTKTIVLSYEGDGMWFKIRHGKISVVIEVLFHVLVMSTEG